MIYTSPHQSCTDSPAPCILPTQSCLQFLGDSAGFNKSTSKPPSQWSGLPPWRTYLYSHSIPILTSRPRPYLIHCLNAFQFGMDSTLHRRLEGHLWRAQSLLDGTWRKFDFRSYKYLIDQPILHKLSSCWQRVLYILGHPLWIQKVYYIYVKVHAALFFLKRKETHNRRVSCWAHARP